MKKLLSLFIIIVSFNNLAFSQENLLLKIKPKADNPGNLEAFIYSPKNVSPDTPLIVLLHGCTQDVDKYFVNSGWKDFAEKLNLFLLFPVQKSSNNPMSCFNWFEKNDQQKNKGEPLSIFNLIKQVQKDYDLLENKVFISGFSAGAGMGANMLSLYPELFESGALIAGIPFGCASSSSQGFLCMFGMTSNSPENWATKVYKSNPQFNGPFPTVSIWRGLQDYTVKPAAGQELVKQWVGVHKLDMNMLEVEEKDSYTVSRWKKKDRTLVELHTLNNLSHAIPINTKEPAQCGQQGSWEKEDKACATREILKFWKLLP